jgi:PP-loop superfamily ATP-utilizing enzyme
VKQADLQKLHLIREKISGELVELGFGHIEIDEEGLVSGKLNRVLSTSELKNNQL